MEKIVLPNGLKVFYKHKPGRPVVVQVLVNIGSNHELPGKRGITHFIEHMVFEGTKKRPTNREISNEIEKVGGDFNAYTTNERTCFHVRVLKKHFHIAVDVLGDMLQNSLFKKEHINKEKNIVVKEIDLVYDEPKFYQWILLQKKLFSKHPARNAIYGNKKDLHHLKRDDIVHFFKKYYVAKNMTVAIVGDVPDWKKVVKKNFTFSAGKASINKCQKAVLLSQNKFVKEKRKTSNSYAVLGFKTVPVANKDSYVLEVINGILGRGQSGRLFTELRSKQGLAYDVGTQHVAEVSFGFFAAYAVVDKKNLHKVKSLVLQEIENLKNVRPEDIKEAQDFIEGDYYLGLDDSQKVADQMLFWKQSGDIESMEDYVGKVKKVSVADVKRVIEKYFKRHAFAVIEGK